VSTESGSTPSAAVVLAHLSTSPPADLAASATQRSADRPPRPRGQPEARSPPLGHRTLDRLADRLPPAHPSLRALRPAVHRIPHPRRHTHLLQEAHHARQALRPPVRAGA